MDRSGPRTASTDVPGGRSPTPRNSARSTCTRLQRSGMRRVRGSSGWLRTVHPSSHRTRGRHADTRRMRDTRKIAHSQRRNRTRIGRPAQRCSGRLRRRSSSGGRMYRRRASSHPPRPAGRPHGRRSRTKMRTPPRLGRAGIPRQRVGASPRTGPGTGRATARAPHRHRWPSAQGSSRLRWSRPLSRTAGVSCIACAHGRARSVAFPSGPLAPRSLRRYRR